MLQDNGGHEDAADGIELAIARTRAAEERG